MACVKFPFISLIVALFVGLKPYFCLNIHWSLPVQSDEWWRHYSYLIQSSPLNHGTHAVSVCLFYHNYDVL